MQSTQITKSETFALSFVAFITMQAALKEAELQPKEIRQQIKETILESVINHPNPAEA